METIIHKDRESWNFLLHNTFALSVKIVASCVLRYLQIAILCDHNIVLTSEGFLLANVLHPIM